MRPPCLTPMVIVTSPLTLDWTAEGTATEEDTDSAYSLVLHYEDWLPEWTQLIARAPTRPCIPSTDYIISTPLNLHHWSCSLESYPNRALADFVFLKDFILVSHMDQSISNHQRAT